MYSLPPPPPPEPSPVEEEGSEQVFCHERRMEGVSALQNAPDPHVDPGTHLVRGGHSLGLADRLRGELADAGDADQAHGADELVLQNLQHAHHTVLAGCGQAPALQAAQGYGIGERLIETQLAEQYGTSRSSVREALRILAGRGSVELASGRGGVVRGYSLDQIADAFAAAGMLMALAVRYIAQQRGDAVLARIGERVDRLERMVARGFSPPLEFATTLGGFTAAIVVLCLGVIPFGSALALTAALMVSIGWNALLLVLQQARLRALASRSMPRR